MIKTFRHAKSVLTPHRSFSEKIDQFLVQTRKKHISPAMEAALSEFNSHNKFLKSTLQHFAKHIDDYDDSPVLSKIPLDFVRTHISDMITGINGLMESKKTVSSYLLVNDHKENQLLDDYTAQMIGKMYRFTLCLLQPYNPEKKRRGDELLRIYRRDNTYNEFHEECVPLKKQIKTWAAANAHLSALSIAVNTLINTLNGHIESFEEALIPQSIWKVSNG